MPMAVSKWLAASVWGWTAGSGGAVSYWDGAGGEHDGLKVTGRRSSTTAAHQTA